MSGALELRPSRARELAELAAPAIARCHLPARRKRGGVVSAICPCCQRRIYLHLGAPREVGPRRAPGVPVLSRPAPLRFEDIWPLSTRQVAQPTLTNNRQFHR